MEQMMYTADDVATMLQVSKSKGHSMKAKDELASLKRDLARAYKLIDRIRPLAVSRKEIALYNGVLIVAVWLVKKYKIEV